MMLVGVADQCRIAGLGAQFGVVGTADDEAAISAVLAAAHDPIDLDPDLFILRRFEPSHDDAATGIAVGREVAPEVLLGEDVELFDLRPSCHQSIGLDQHRR